MKNTTLYIIWNNETNIGIPIIDEQHRGIVATLNSLHYFIQQGYGLDALQPTLQIMGKYIGFHLKTEEMILGECNYPKRGSPLEPVTTIYCVSLKLDKYARGLYMLIFKHSS